MATGKINSTKSKLYEEQRFEMDIPRAARQGEFHINLRKTYR